MSFWNQFLGASECIVLGFFKHILCPSGAIHHWSVMACDCKCGQVLQAELAELKQRRQKLREVASCLGWMGVWCFQSATFLCLACVRPSKLTKHTWRPRRSERPSWSRRSLVLFLPVDGTMYVLSEIYPKVLTIYWDVDKIPQHSIPWSLLQAARQLSVSDLQNLLGSMTAERTEWVKTTKAVQVPAVGTSQVATFYGYYVQTNDICHRKLYTERLSDIIWYVAYCRMDMHEVCRQFMPQEHL